MNRREFIKLSALAAGAIINEQLLAGYVKSASAENPSALKGSVSDLAVKAMDFEIIFETEIINPPKHGENVSIWIPLSESSYEQDVTQFSVDSPVAFHINEEPYYRNKMIYVGPIRLNAGDKISITYKIRRRTVNIIEDKDEDIKRHLVLIEKEEWDENISKFVNKLVSGENNHLKIGRKIYYSLVDFLIYDKETIGCGPGISTITFENRKGRCADFHSLFRTMMIYKGIPVRWKQGILLPYPSEMVRSGKMEGDCVGTHCWVEFYIGYDKWVPVDLVEGKQREDLRDYCFGTLSPNRFNISTGKNIILKPPQQGEPLNTLPITYGEYEGIPLIYGHHYRNNLQYKVLNVEV